MANHCHNERGVPAASFNEAWNNTDTVLDDLRGLTVVLLDLARESGMIDHASYDTSPLMALIRVVQEKTNEVVGLHEAQHDAWKAERGAAQATPVAAWFQKWREAAEAETTAFAKADPSHEHCPNCTHASDAVHFAVQQVLAIPARNERDWLLKLWAASDGGDLAMYAAENASLWAEAKAFVGGAA